MGFRKLGFKNKIFLFEPNKYLFKNIKKKLIKNYKNIYAFNFALGEKNEIKNFITLIIKIIVYIIFVVLIKIISKIV